MKHITTLYYNNNNIKGLTSKNIITIIAKTIKIIELFRGEKNLKILIKEKARKKTKIIIIIALIMGKKFNQRKKRSNNFNKRANKKWKTNIIITLVRI